MSAKFIPLHANIYTAPPDLEDLRDKLASLIQRDDSRSQKQAERLARQIAQIERIIRQERES